MRLGHYARIGSCGSQHLRELQIAVERWSVCRTEMAGMIAQHRKKNPRRRRCVGKPGESHRAETLRGDVPFEEREHFVAHRVGRRGIAQARMNTQPSSSSTDCVCTELAAA